eukprot:Blabericola_migrator_1__10501@NODE_5952_length_635_cov_5_739437_g3950_i0_p1_GENE_NODE_5952_length_635_cov_5_739437_g3950_i0NODE_5952_length_635_cov_5_739437_g3950_i0_p1_ORF_typecomplete_len102_score10_19_NODE_5952_length_635_cov_5_739437_g3950_i0271576
MVCFVTICVSGLPTCVNPDEVDPFCHCRRFSPLSQLHPPLKLVRDTIVNSPTEETLSLRMTAPIGVWDRYGCGDVLQCADERDFIKPRFGIRALVEGCKIL